MSDKLKIMQEPIVNAVLADSMTESEIFALDALLFRQYTDPRRVAGIAREVDINRFNGDRGRLEALPSEN